MPHDDLAVALPRAIVLATAAAALAAPAALAGHEPLFTTHTGHATAQVPGLTGVEFSTFRRPVRSPDGRRWAMLAGTTAGAMLLVDNGDGAGLHVVLQEGEHAPWTAADSGETVGDSLFDRNLTILDDGRFIFTDNTDGGDSAFDEYVVLFDGANYVTVAQEGQPVPASAGLPAGALYGSTLDSPQLDASGRTGFRATLAGVSSGENQALFFDGQVVAQIGVDSPSGQLNGAAETYRDFTGRSYYRSIDGLTWIVNGRINGDSAQDRVAIVNGEVVAQEGATLSVFSVPIGTAITSQPITDVQMTYSGDWFVRGVNTDDGGWVMRNGEITQRSFDPITPGSTEIWDSFRTVPFLNPPFFTSIGNDAGDTLIAGITTIFPVDYSGVVLLNGEHVVVRSFDPIDLNGDGEDNDDFYVWGFFFDDAFLTNDGRVLMNVRTRNNAGDTLGEAILDIDVSDLLSDACPCELDGDDAQVNVFDLLAYLDLWFASDAAAEIDGTPGVDVFDLLAYLDCWFPASGGTPCG
jgi:hypothetical protein